MHTWTHTWVHRAWLGFCTGTHSGTSLSQPSLLCLSPPCHRTINTFPPLPLPTAWSLRSHLLLWATALRRQQKGFWALQVLRPTQTDRHRGKAWHGAAASTPWVARPLAYELPVLFPFVITEGNTVDLLHNENVIVSEDLMKVFIRRHFFNSFKIYISEALAEVFWPNINS